MSKRHDHERIGMSIKPRIYKAALVGLAVLLFGGSAQMQSRLNQQRGDLGLTYLAPLENAPPLLAFTTVALGGFRGLIANALWIRASDLQENEKFFEMVQLADWITDLEPHFTHVWTMQAWNMAYNISVKFKDPEDRWRWVERGIRLLRDRGIPLNPDTALMYRELSWFFQHKMGQDLDDAHMRYKLRWAQEMQGVLGGRPDFEALFHPNTAAERERARKLAEDYKMKPAIIQKVDQEYGPFDWRLPTAHAIYWAEAYRQRTNANPADSDTLRRSIFQSMQMAFFIGGALSPNVTNVTERNFMLWPNLDQVPKINDTYLKMIAEQPNLNFQNGHKNFLKQAIPALYLNGRFAEAAHWFNYLTNLYTNAFVGRQANISLADFVAGTVTEDIGETDMKKVNYNLVNLITMELLCLLRDNDAKATDYKALAEFVWHHYMEKIGTMSEVRLRLPPLPEIYQRVLDETMKSLSPYDQAYLRTKLGLPNPKAAPPAAGRARRSRTSVATRSLASPKRNPRNQIASETVLQSL